MKAFEDTDSKGLGKGGVFQVLRDLDCQNIPVDMRNE